MRALIVLALATASTVGCTRWSMDHHLNNAYRAYDRGDCQKVMLELSQVDRTSRARPFITRKCHCCVASAWNASSCSWMPRKRMST